jgi:hypothetical protein
MKKFVVFWNETVLSTFWGNVLYPLSKIEEYNTSQDGSSMFLRNVGNFGRVYAMYSRIQRPL